VVVVVVGGGGGSSRLHTCGRRVSAHSLWHEYRTGHHHSHPNHDDHKNPTKKKVGNG